MRCFAGFSLLAQSLKCMKRIVISQKLHQAKVSLRSFLRDTVVDEEKQNRWLKFLRVFVLAIVVAVGYVIIGHSKSWPYAAEWYNMLSLLFQ